MLWWQGPTLLNPHFAVGTKDQDASRIFYEPLAGWDPDGNLAPVLAAEIPTVENGGLSEEGTSVIWKLKQGVKWHDGQPFTADDCVFNWEYAADPATAATTIGTYQDIKVTKVDDHTIRVEFKKPTPFWADAFVGVNGMIIPKHLFEPYKGAKSREAPANLAPVGTGAYLFVDFKPGDLVQGKLNPNYHMPNRPYFDTIEMKGGGDAVSAARAVLQTGEYDFAWNMQVEDEILKRLEASGKGRVEILPGGSIEHIQLNNTDPWHDVDGERSSIKSKHPYLTDPAVRDALNLLVDRASVHKFIYGRTGDDTANFVNAPDKFVSKNTHYEFNVDKAIKLLDDAGWKPGADGVREKNGVKLHAVYQTSINAPRQKTQEIVKQACQKAGISIEIKSVTASVFFSSDVANPDTYPHFVADLQMYTTTMPQPDPGVFMRQFLSAEVASKANKFQGRNITRWQNADYDKLLRAERQRAQSGQACGAVHRHERHGDQGRGGHSGRDPSRRCGHGQEPARSVERLGQQYLRLAGLVSADADAGVGEPLPHPTPADRHTESARHQRRAVHHPGARAGRSVRRTRHQPCHSARGAGGAARQVRHG